MKLKISQTRALLLLSLLEVLVLVKTTKRSAHVMELPYGNQATLILLLARFDYLVFSTSMKKTCPALADTTGTYFLYVVLPPGA